MLGIAISSMRDRVIVQHILTCAIRITKKRTPISQSEMTRVKWNKLLLITDSNA